MFCHKKMLFILYPFFKQTSIKESALETEEDLRYVKSPVGRFHSFDSSKPPSATPVMLQPIVDDEANLSARSSSFSANRLSRTSNSATAAPSPHSTTYSAIVPRSGSKSLQEGITVLPQRLDSYRAFRGSTFSSGDQQQQQRQQHHHASNHYPSLYGRLVASAANRFSSASSSANKTASHSSSSSSSNPGALSSQQPNQHREIRNLSHNNDHRTQQSQQQQQQHNHRSQQLHQLQHRSLSQPHPESPSAYMLDRGQSLITTFQTKRGKTETLTADSENVLQYPPPMAPISMLMRK